MFRIMLVINFLFLFLVFEINCEEVNETKPIINKCCSFGKYVNYDPIKRYFCANYKERSNFSEFVIYDKNYKITRESLENAYEIVPGKFRDESFRMLVVDIEETVPTANLFLIKESGLILEIPNNFNRYHQIDSDRFCIDHLRTKENETLPKFWVLWEPPLTYPGVFHAIAMLVSSQFLLIVVIVYALLPELRNLRGLMLMAYVSSLLLVFVLIAILTHSSFKGHTCVNLACVLYFFHLATYCWMNIMSYDIWWTFRLALARPIHRGGELFKFAIYSIYGYGLPLAMTVFLRVINDVDLTHRPWFIKPNIRDNFCCLEGDHRMVYLYIPVFILILINWIFYLMTALNVWRVNRDNAALNLAAATIPKQRLPVHSYLKLTIIMCLNGTLDVLFHKVPALDKLHWISDTYNMLIGGIIFIILVCKPKILKRLAELYHGEKIV